MPLVLSLRLFHSPFGFFWVLVIFGRLCLGTRSGMRPAHTARAQLSLAATFPCSRPGSLLSKENRATEAVGDGNTWKLGVVHVCEAKLDLPSEGCPRVPCLTIEEEAPRRVRLTSLALIPAMSEASDPWRSGRRRHLVANPY